MMVRPFLVASAGGGAAGGGDDSAAGVEYSPRDAGPRPADELEAVVGVQVAKVPAPLLQWLSASIGSPDGEDFKNEAVEVFCRAVGDGTLDDLIAGEILEELDDPTFCQRQKAEGGAVEADGGFDDMSVASPVPF
jgi:hypothetical protein